MRACGYEECRILPTSIPGTLRSSVYLPAPVVFSAASTIAVALPMMEKSPLILLLPGFTSRKFVIPSEARNLLFACSGTSFRCQTLPFSGDCRLDRLIHLAVSGAAAQIAAQRSPNFGFRGIGIFR